MIERPHHFWPHMDIAIFDSLIFGRDMKKKIIAVLVLCSLMMAAPVQAAGRCPYTMTMLAIAAISEPLARMFPGAARPIRIVGLATGGIVVSFYTWRWMRAQCPTIQDRESAEGQKKKTATPSLSQ